MKKLFHHGYPWLFIDIQNSILDVSFNYGIHNFGIHNLVVDILQNRTEKKFIATISFAVYNTNTTQHTNCGKWGWNNNVYMPP